METGKYELYQEQLKGEHFNHNVWGYSELLKEYCEQNSHTKDWSNRSVDGTKLYMKS